MSTASKTHNLRENQKGDCPLLHTDVPLVPEWIWEMKGEGDEEGMSNGRRRAYNSRHGTWRGISALDGAQQCPRELTLYLFYLLTECNLWINQSGCGVLAIGPGWQ